MKKIQLFLIIISLGILGCNDDAISPQEFPIIKTLPVSDHDRTGVSLQAELLVSGNINTNTFGFVWDDEPIVSQSTPNQVIVGQDLPEGSFTARITSDLTKGVTYYVRAFATYSDKTVYGTSIEFVSEGTPENPWTLELEEIQDFAIHNFGRFTGSQTYGGSTKTMGYVVSDERNFFTYKPGDDSFVRADAYPGTIWPIRVLSGSFGGNQQYFWDTSNEKIYQYDETGWSIVSEIPFIYIFNDYFHTHLAGSKLYLFGNRNTILYDIESDTWTALANRFVFNDAFKSGVSLGDKVYCLSSRSQVWVYDIPTNHWEVEGTFPGVIGERVLGYGYDDKIYFGLSFSNTFSNNTNDETLLMDDQFWSYDLTQKTWDAVKTFPANNLNVGDIFSFTLNDKLYFGRNVNDGSGYDLWSFSP